MREERKFFYLFFFPGTWKIETDDLRLIDLFIQTQEARKQTKEVTLQFQVFFFEIQLKKKEETLIKQR